MLGHRARKRFSQNFLHDAHYIERIASVVQARPGERIVEIGPGLGALTAPLVAAAGHLTCLEIDRDLAQRLRERFTPAQLTLVEGDALDFDWHAFAATDPRPLKIVGNLPYHISTPLLFALLPIAEQVQSQHFMLQKEVVDRMVAAPGGKDYGRLSVMLQRRYALTRLFIVPAGAFSPPPQVQSAIVRLVPHPVASLAAVDTTQFSRVVTAAFTQRRKTLRNALASVLDERAIEAAQVDPGERAEQLPVAAFVALAREAERLATSPRPDGAS
jgi:16S rRNA (adenine1518-N6/adenine1519-N6)-dimethyltransferase